MNFSEPLPFEEALRQARERGLLPTNLSSAELREMDDQILRANVFSARTNHAAILQRIKDLVAGSLHGKFNEATARALLQDEYDKLGYDPERGFAGLEDPAIPPAERGSLRDLSSAARTELVLRTQMRQMANRGYRAEGLTPAALFAFPAWELIRIYPRTVPRDDWPQRFETAGGTLSAGRMVALKTSLVWRRLGDPEMFDDAIGTDYPPFAFGSGMGWKQVPREVCKQLGIGTEQERTVASMPAPRLDAVEKKLPEGLDREFLRKLRDDLDLEIKEGVAKLKAAE